MVEKLRKPWSLPGRSGAFVCSYNLSLVIFHSCCGPKQGPIQCSIDYLSESALEANQRSFSRLFRRCSMQRWTSRWNYAGWLCRSRLMLVNQLPLVIIFRMCLPVGASKRLRGLISFEAQIKLLLMLCLVHFSHALIVEHEIVMGLQVFRVYAEYPL